MTRFIYILTSPSGKKYVGQTFNTNYRFYFYKNLHCKNQIKLYYALLKYGFDSFEKEIIQFDNTSIDNINDIEMELIKKYDSFSNGYNSSIGGENNKAKYYTEEERIIGEKYVAKQYHNKNKKKIKEYYKEYNKTYFLRPEVKENCHLKDLRRKDSHNKQRHDHRLQNLDEIRLKEREYYEKNKERIRGVKRKLYAKNKQGR